MRRGLLVGLVVALLLVAGTASAGMYASLRITGNGNYNPYSLIPQMYKQYYSSLASDTGFFNFKEVAVGFGEELQGEVSIGYSTFKYSYDSPETRADEELSMTWYTIGLAGFYPVMETENCLIDAGLRFQLHSAKIKDVYDYGDRDEWTDTWSASGWSVGPVIRHHWMLADGAIAIGPEIYPKYSSFSTKYEYENGSSGDSDGPDLSGFAIDYSLRMDFYF